MSDYNLIFVLFLCVIRQINFVSSVTVRLGNMKLVR